MTDTDRDRRIWVMEDAQRALAKPPDGYVYTCPACDGDMLDDEAVYSDLFDAYVCKACGCL